MSGHDRRTPGSGTSVSGEPPYVGRSNPRGPGEFDDSGSIDIRPSRQSSASSPHILSGGFGRAPATHSPGERDTEGRLKRSEAAKHAFERAHPCPSTGRSSGPCPGYVIDHITPLKRGGADDPSNMQWQTAADAKAKDKWE